LGLIFNSYFFDNNKVVVNSEEKEDFYYEIEDGYILKEKAQKVTFDVTLPTVDTNNNMLNDEIFNYTSRVIEEISDVISINDAKVTSYIVSYEVNNINDLTVIKLFYDTNLNSRYMSIVFDEEGNIYNTDKILSYYNLTEDSIITALKEYDETLILDSYYINDKNIITLNTLNSENNLSYVSFNLEDGKIITLIP